MEGLCWAYIKKISVAERLPPGSAKGENMKINQVEELVGITKKNIRFYEEQGLISPGRNPENGYREYSLADVEELQKIKLLRRLGVSIEHIRLIREGSLSFDSCMAEHAKVLSQEQHDLEMRKEICRMLSEGTDSFSELKPEQYFDEIKTMERGGARFVDIEKTDVKNKRRWGAIFSGSAVILLVSILMIVLLSLNSSEPMPIGILLYFIVIGALLIAGIVIALVQRMKEIDGGEVDEARKY